MGCYKNIIDSLRLCGNGDDPVDECGQVNCVCHYGDRDPMCRQKIMYDAADAIVELLAAVPKWISVKERLPEQGERVLVSNGGFICESYLSQSGKWKRGGVDMFFMTPTHWMPLLKPPKEVE